MRKLVLAVVLAGGVALGANAQDGETEAPKAQAGPCDAEAFHQFDFWLGEWTVTTPTGQVAGTNKISSEENGCLILEKWTSANGGTGQSYNFYNPVTDKWRQVWVSPSALIDYEGGLTETGSMRLEGTITYTASGQSADFTGEWTPNADGTVTQHFEQYDAAKDEWSPWFTGLYTRVSSDTL